VTAPQIFTPEYYERMRALESTSWWNAGMRDVAGMLLRDVRLPATGTMLDVGCGSGQTGLWFGAMYPGWRVIGLDLAPEGLSAARNLGIDVSRASALDLPHRDASVDAVVTLDVMQHLPLNGGDLRAMREIRRVLKPGGVLMLRTNAQAFPRTPDDVQFDFHRYDPRELRGKLEDAGFAVIRLSRINALLGLAEIPRELRAGRTQASAYHGILGQPSAEARWAKALKRRWLRLEGRIVSAGLRLPMGRTILAACRAR